MNEKQIILQITKKDFRWEYFSGSGAGGQNRNRKKNCVRLFHDPSKCNSVAQDHKSKSKNEEDAFRRLVNQDKFMDWLRLECYKKSVEARYLEDNVKTEMIKFTAVETKDEKGKWKENEDLKITEQDVENSFK